MKTATNTFKHGIILILLSLFFATSVYARDKKDFKFISSEARFGITFPVKYFEKTKQGKNSIIHNITALKGLTVYTIKYGINEEPLKKGTENLFISKVKDMYVGSGKLEEDKLVMMAGRDATDLKIITEKIGQKIYTHMRILVKRKTWYTLMVYSNNAFPPEKDILAFFNSFYFTW